MNTALVNEDAERTVLACAMLDTDALYQIVPLLSPDDFSLQAHRQIYHVIAELAQSGQPVEELTVSNALGANGQLGSVGGVDYLEHLIIGLGSELARATNASHHAALILDRSRRRRMRAAAQSLLDATADASVSTDDCAYSIGESLLRIEAALGRGTSARHIREIMPETLREIELQSQNQGLVGMTTGLHSLDLATGGMRPGELWTLGALPGKGKTSLGLGFTLANAKQATPVLVFSLEMQDIEISKRLLSANSTISGAHIRNPQTMGNRWKDLGDAAGEIAELPIFIDSRGAVKIHELLATARLFVRREKVKLIVVDYVRLVDAPGRDLRDKISAVANSLRELAKSERIGVLLLSQLRRPENVNARPTMLDLKESGELEAGSHVVLLPYLPTNSAGSAIPEEQVLIIGKNRNGPVGQLPVYFSEDRLQFFDRTNVASAR